MKKLVTALALAIFATATQADTLPLVRTESTIPYENPADVTWKRVNQNCRWDHILLEELKKQTKNRILIAPAATDGNVLTLKLLAILDREPSEKTGPRWLDVQGQLLDATAKSLGDFGFRYELYADAFERCKYARDIGESLAGDIAEWLESPQAGIKVAEVVDSLYPDIHAPSAWQSCSNRSSLPYYLNQYLPSQVYRVSDNLDKASGKKLFLKVSSARLLGGGIFTGPRWFKIVGSLVNDGHEIGSFIAYRHSFRSWTTCGIVDRLNYELAGDIAQWLAKPSMNARLGDADASTDAAP